MRKTEEVKSSAFCGSEVLRNEPIRCRVTKTEIPALGLGSEIAGLFSKVGLEGDIPELRGRLVLPFARNVRLH
jgi:hypothetical protein